MKILHVTQNYYPSVGGTQHTIKRISEYFSQSTGDEVTVLTSNSLYGPNRPVFKEISVRKEVINGVMVKRFPFVRFHLPLLKLTSRILKRVFKKPLPEFLIALVSGPISSKLNQAIDDTDADVIGASSIDYLFADYPVKRHKRKNARPFVIYGALHLHNNKVLNIYKKRIEAADYYIANTPYEKKVIVEMGIEDEKVKVIGAGSDIYQKADFSISDDQLRATYNIPPGTIIITYVGRHEVLKGIPMLIKTFQQLKAQFNNIQLFICGAAGGYTSTLQALAIEGSHIQLFTNVTDLQKTEILRLTDLLVLPSKEESFGVVFLEAWSFSKPVIGANIGAIASLIEDGADGLLFDAESEESLAEKMTTLIQNEALRKLMGAAGNNKYRQHFTWDIIAEKFRQVYQLAITKFNNKQAV